MISADTLITQNIPEGVYTVGDKRFVNKVDALIYSSKHGGHPTWSFHDEWFSSFDWTVEPSETLTYFYTQRVQQIRDKYDHIVLHYSGGADSHNILTHFYLNNIHVDEILVSLPFSWYNKFKTRSESTAAYDMHNEWIRVIKPDLEWVNKHMPNTKITLDDYTQQALSFEKNADTNWVTTLGDHLNPNVVARAGRYHRLSTTDLYNKRKVGHVYGIDKPFVFTVDGKWYSAFLDSFLTMQTPPMQGINDHINIEFFYWTPEMPHMIIKQAHAIKNYYQAHTELLHIASHRAKTPAERELERDIARQAIYPYWRNSIFQCAKGSGTFIKEHDAWFYEGATQKAIDTYHEGMRYLTSGIIDKKWFNFTNDGIVSGFTGFWSKWHPL